MEIIYIFKILNKSCDMHVSIDAVIDHWSFWLLIQLMHRNKLKRHMLLLASKIFSKPKSQTLTNTMFSGACQRKFDMLSIFAMLNIRRHLNLVEW